MTFLRLTVLTLFSFVLLYSCKKEKSFETGGSNSLKSEWEFKEGKLYQGKVDTAYISDSGPSVKTLFLEGTSVNGKELLSIEVIGISTTSPATYKTPQVVFSYQNSATSIYGNDLTATGDFTVVITNIDSANVSGTFTGKAKDSAGVLKTITEGKFTAKLKASVVNPPPANAQVTFWAKSSCGVGGNITVKLNNITALITAFTSNEPATCGSQGAATFTLPAGSYTWKASCGSQDSTSGVLTVTANQCVKQQVVFAAPTNCRISDIAFYDTATNIPLGSIHSLYNASNVVSNVQIIDSVNHVILKNFVLTYPAGKIQINSNQYFLLDGSGRVSEFHGHQDPSDDSTANVVVKYYYDAGSYMNKFTVEYVDTPGIIKWQGILEYAGGNLVKITENNPSNATGGRIETTYAYYTDLVKNFLYFIPSGDIIYFQSAINAGKTSQNAVKTETVKTLGPSGNVLSQGVTNYTSYSIDNTYVRSFKNSGDGNIYGSDLKFVLSYKCF